MYQHQIAHQVLGSINQATLAIAIFALKDREVRFVTKYLERCYGSFVVYIRAPVGLDYTCIGS